MRLLVLALVALSTMSEDAHAGDARLPPPKTSPAGVRYRVAGPRHGRPVVLIHGNGSDLHSFDGVVSRLAGDHRVLTYDQRGQGQTPPSGNDYSTTAMARDLKALVDHERFAAFHLVGHSMGGRTAVRFTSLFPGAVRSLLIEDMELHSRGPAGSIPNAHTLSAPMLHGIKAGAEDLLPAFRSARTPAMILVAEHDSAVTPLGYRRMSAARPDAAGILVPGSDHFVHLSRPEDFLRLLGEHHDDAEAGRRWTPRPWALR